MARGRQDQCADFAEGWFVSTRDLASGMWIFAIARHTFSAVIMGKKLPYSIFLLGITALWLFIYALAVGGVVSHRENFYVRAGAWVSLTELFESLNELTLVPGRWIDEQYAFERLWLHSFWIFVTMFGTIVLYAIIYSALNARLRPDSMASTASLAPPCVRVLGPNPRTINRAARYMIIYPTVYVLCILPLAAGRMVAMTHHVIPYWYYCTAGAAITSCGWLDVVMYATSNRLLQHATADGRI
jgi:hypothetical protein